MPGWITDGMPLAAPQTANGVVATAPNGLSTQPTSGGLNPVDIGGTGGASPQTVALTNFQIAAIAAALSVNTATSTVHAATLNTTEGMVTTEALTTAAGATYTFTLTNSLLVAGAAAPQVVMRDGTNTAGAVQLNSVTNAVGSSVFVFQNVGTAAWNGTKLIAFHV